MRRILLSGRIRWQAGRFFNLSSQFKSQDKILNVVNQVECWVCGERLERGDEYREHLSMEHVDTAIADNFQSFDF